MPLYICNSKKDVIDSKARQAIARDITRIHCAVTGAPESFVHAVFFEEAPQFPLDDKTLYVMGTIRKGRSDTQQQEIAQAIRASLAQQGGVGLEHTEARIRETPASWVLEGGEIMPEPGEEEAWFAAQAARRQTADA